MQPRLYRAQRQSLRSQHVELGAEIDAAGGDMNFSPVPELLSKDEPFKTFWSSERARGTCSQTWNADEQVWRSSLDVLGGE